MQIYRAISFDCLPAAAEKRYADLCISASDVAIPREGIVVAVRGAILDVSFDGAALPAVGEALVVMPGDLAPVRR
ncbi:hypothetical protein [Paraburkholderia phenoliruptrix]|uniref:hypothetical protein n=1 Tax=Paraburkholderia phenoliruptrix TaxID=252970 RepID=UPI00040BFAD8